LGDRFRIEEQKSAVAMATAARLVADFCAEISKNWNAATIASALAGSLALRSSGRLWIAVQTGPFDADGALRDCYRRNLITRSRRIGMASVDRDIHEPLEYGRIGLGF
jgi:hypothetical protein